MASVRVGQAVRFIDSNYREHDALVLVIHAAKDGVSYPEEFEWPDGEVGPTINVVHAASEDSKTDPYGRQIERPTSVMHKQQTVGMPRAGFCWDLL